MVTMSKSVPILELLSFFRDAKLDSAGKSMVSATQVTEPTNDMNRSKCGTVQAAMSVIKQLGNPNYLQVI